MAKKLSQTWKCTFNCALLTEPLRITLKISGFLQFEHCTISAVYKGLELENLPHRWCHLSIRYVWNFLIFLDDSFYLLSINILVKDLLKLTQPMKLIKRDVC